MSRVRIAVPVLVIGLATSACGGEDVPIPPVTGKRAADAIEGLDLAASYRRTSALALAKGWMNRDWIPADVRSELQRTLDVADQRDAALAQLKSEMEKALGEAGAASLRSTPAVGELRFAIWTYIERLGTFVDGTRTMPPVTPLQSECWTSQSLVLPGGRSARIALLKKAGDVLFRANAVYGRQKGEVDNALMVALRLAFFESRGNSTPTRADAQQTLSGGPLYGAFREYGSCVWWLPPQS